MQDQGRGWGSGRASAQLLLEDLPYKRSIVTVKVLEMWRSTYCWAGHYQKFSEATRLCCMVLRKAVSTLPFLAVYIIPYFLRSLCIPYVLSMGC